MPEFDLQALHFLRPWWLIAALPGIWVAFSYSRRQAGEGGWQHSIEPTLLEALLEGSESAGGRAGAILLGAALTLASIGLAGPSVSRLPQPVEQRSNATVIVLDLSLSMLAADLSPSRIVRARHKITDLLRDHEEGFVGLIAYAGDAHTVAPLTDDTRTVINLLNALAPEMMPVFGSDAADAVEQARKLFRNATIGQGLIVLVTDGVERIGEVTRLADRQYPISILGVGTAAGAPIPLDFADQPGRVLRDDQGRPVIARLDSERLQTVAELSWGRYAEIALDDRDITHLLETPLPGPDQTIETDRVFDTWADLGYWFGLLLLPFALIAFRRGVLVCLVLVAAPADAAWWSDLWQRPDQQAHQALMEGQPERAANLFEDPQWRGVANYRSDLFEEASADFAADTSPRGHYNRGNALARQQRIDEALAAYDQTLALDPDHEDAAFNKALLEQLKEQQQSGAGQSRDPAQDSQNPDADTEQQQAPAGSQGADQRALPDPDSGDPQQPDPSDSPNEDERRDQQLAREESRDERGDALEQWLRRVPDDPGGLLRRKFQHETNQRMRRGEYTSPDQRIW